MRSDDGAREAAFFRAMPIDYSKFDHLEDSDDEDSKAEPQGRILPSNDAALASGQRAQATVKAGVILKTIATADGRAAYINIVGSSAVEGGMSASAAAPRGLDSNVPFIVGDVRTDDDGQLGDGTTTHRNVFVQVTNEVGTPITTAAAINTPSATCTISS